MVRSAGSAVTLDSLGGLALVAVLLVANAFFVIAEYAFVRVRETQLVELVPHSRRARLSLQIVHNLDSYISAGQVGVTLANLLLGFLGEPALSSLLRPAFDPLVPLAPELVRGLSFVITFGMISFLTLVVSELTPKQIALQAALPIALWCAFPLEAFRRLMAPFVLLVHGSARALVRLLGFKPGVEVDVHSEEELKLLVAASTTSGALQESERRILVNALTFADRSVRQLMVPRTEVTAVPEDADRARILQVARRRPYSRFPVYRGTIDRIVGVMHLRDLALRPDEPTAGQLMRPAVMLPETMRADEALAALRRSRASLAIVIDEFGGTAGLITVEDVIEELVGEVHDEFEAVAVSDVHEIEPGRFLVDGLVPLPDAVERLEIADAPEEALELYETVGGMVFGELGRVPVVGDRVSWAGWVFDVRALDGRRVATVGAARAAGSAGDG